MDKHVDGFDTLLRPVHDAITTNWEKTIKSYLEKYLEYLYGLNSTNFSEAALILDNSSKFYSKRIDLLYKDLINFILYMNEVGSREEGVENQATKQGRRRIANTFHNEDLKVLSFIHSEHKTNITLDNIGKNGPGKKSVILNPSVKIPIKSGTACQIYQSDGKELGYKDEFRLFWPITSAGLLSEDFHIKGDHCLEIFAGSILEESRDDSDNASCVNDPPHDFNHVDEAELELRTTDQQPPTEEPPDPGPESPICVSPPLPERMRTRHQNNKQDEKTINKPVDWGPISFNFVLPVRKLGARKVFKLPHQLIADVIEERKKRKRKSESTEGVNDVLVMSEILYQKEIMDGSCNGLKIKCNLSKKNRRELSVKRRLNGLIVNGDERNAEAGDELEEDYVEEDACLSDNELETDAVSPVQLQLNGLTDTSQDPDRIDAAMMYLNSALHIMAKYNDLRKKISMKATELARRVSEWHESIMPALEAAESRSIFNVHEYGSKILDVFSDGDTSTVTEFGEIVKKQPKVEICRFLLASLMLANTYNVEIKKSNDSDLAKDCLQLRLLSKVRHHEILNENIGATAADSHC